ncbi:MAG TPA: hypothetical protein VN033_00800 [Vulgatibacter sp.]|nr:hypothetical protein [Vulgatibacter sp.]
MATRRGAGQSWRLFVLCAVAALAGALLAFWLGERRDAPAPQRPPDPRGEEIRADAAPPPEEPVVPLNGIDRLVAIADEEVCAIDGGAIACSDDAGRTWRSAGELGGRILALLRSADGHLVAATDDGAIHTLDRDGRPLRRRTLPSAGDEPPHVVDAQEREGRIWILVHRFDRPEDPMRLPRVVETAVYAVDADSIERAAATGGFTGDRLLAGARGEGVTFASADARAWRYDTTGFRRIPDARRFGARYDGIEVAVERWAERLEGPGRPARPASRVVVSHDGGETWVPAFHANGEALVDFLDAQVGLVVARDEGTAWLTANGGVSFTPARRDDRLHLAIAVVHAGGRFVVASSDARILIVEP